MYKVVKVRFIEKGEKIPFDRCGAHATGRVITYERQEDGYLEPKGSLTEVYEFDDDPTVDLNEEELLNY